MGRNLKANNGLDKAKYAVNTLLFAVPTRASQRCDLSNRLHVKELREFIRRSQPSSSKNTLLNTLLNTLFLEKRVQVALVTVSWHACAAAARKKVKICAAISLHYVIEVKLVVAALKNRLRSLPLFAATSELDI